MSEYPPQGCYEPPLPFPPLHVTSYTFLRGHMTQKRYATASSYHTGDKIRVTGTVGRRPVVEVVPFAWCRPEDPPDSVLREVLPVLLAYCCYSHVDLP